MMNIYKHDEDKGSCPYEFEETLHIKGESKYYNDFEDELADLLEKYDYKLITKGDEYHGE